MIPIGVSLRNDRLRMTHVGEVIPPMFIEQGCHTALAAMSSLCDIAQSQPFIGPFAVVLKKCINVCEVMKMNQSNAAKFRSTLQDVAVIIDEIVRTILSSTSGTERQQRLQLLEQYVKDLKDILERAVTDLDAFTKKGFLGKLLAGTLPSDKFREYDSLLSQKLNQLNAVLSISQQSLLEDTYSAITNIDQWCNDNGGLAALLNDQKKLQQLATAIGRCSFFIYRSASI
jgi:hypothetical protein